MHERLCVSVTKLAERSLVDSVCGWVGWESGQIRLKFSLERVKKKEKEIEPNIQRKVTLGGICMKHKKGVSAFIRREEVGCYCTV